MDWAFFKRTFFTGAIGLVGYFANDLHAQYKDQVKATARLEERVLVVETIVPTIDKRLENIERQLQEALRKGR